MRRERGIAGRSAVVESALFFAVLAAVPPTILLVAMNGLAPIGASAGFPLRLWGWAAIAAVVLLALVPIAIAAIARGRAVQWLPRAVLAAEAAWIVYAVLFLNRAELSSLAALDGPTRFRWLLPAAFGLSLLAIAVLPWLRSRSVARAVFALTVLAMGTALFPSRARPAAVEVAHAPAAEPKARERVLLIGLDAGDWKFIEPLIAQGVLPNLARLRDGGAWGPLATVVPTRSPLVWTTIATGRTADDHGIRRYKTTRFEGLYRDLGELRNPHGFAVKEFYDRLRAAGLVFDTTVTSADRRAPAYWTIASDFGIPVSIVNWWATWPAEPTRGATVSERIHFWRLRAKGQPTASERLTYPEELYAELEPLMVRPDQVTFEQAREFLDITADDWTKMRGVTFQQHLLESEFPYIFAMFETDRRIARALMDKGRKAGHAPDDLWVLFRIVDLACHTALHYSPLVEDHLDAKPEELAKYGRMVTEAYRHADRAIGELVDAFGPGNVIIVSDHGFELGMGRNGEKRYVHNKAPAGIFIASGPAFRPGRVEGLSIHEVFPLVMYLKDLPVAEDFAGRVPLEVVSDTFAAAHPMLRIASYGRSDGSTTEILPSESDEMMLERLRALGYIQ